MIRRAKFCGLARRTIELDIRDSAAPGFAVMPVNREAQVRP
jgi:hypothetical protein